MKKKNKILKKIAISLIREKKIDKETIKTLLSLDKESLKAVLFFYKALLSKQRVYVASASPLSKELIKELEEIYPDREIQITIDESLGAGIKIEKDDTITDFTFKKSITDIIEDLN